MTQKTDDKKFFEKSLEDYRDQVWGCARCNWCQTFVAIAAGAGIAKMWGSPRLRPVAVVALIGVLFLIQMPLRDYIGHPKEDLREIAARAGEDGGMSAGFWTDAGVYDHQMKRVRSLDDLQQLIRHAETEGRPLRVAFAHREIAMRDLPECVKLVESNTFKLVAKFPGLEEAQFTACVYEWKGGRE